MTLLNRVWVSLNVLCLFNRCLLKCSGVDVNLTLSTNGYIFNYCIIKVLLMTGKAAEATALLYNPEKVVENGVISCSAVNGNGKRTEIGELYGSQFNK